MRGAGGRDDGLANKPPHSYRERGRAWPRSPVSGAAGGGLLLFCCFRRGTVALCGTRRCELPKQDQCLAGYRRERTKPVRESFAAFFLQIQQSESPPTQPRVDI